MAGRKHKGPITVTSWLDERGRDWGVELHWAILEGRYEPVSIEFFPRGANRGPVTHELIKRFPLGTKIREARREHEALELKAVEWPEFEGKARHLRDEALRFGARRGVALTPEDLRVVAQVYRSAWIEGRPVTRAVADSMGVSTSTAGKRIMAARRAGLLDGVGGTR